MIVSRRLLLLGLIALGSQLATGCYCNRPLLFPRLPLCANGACNGPVFPRLAAAVAPPIAGPVYDVPISHGFSYGGPVYGGAGVGDPGCTACGHGGAGIPLATVPFSGGPIAGTNYAPHPYSMPVAPTGPNPNFAVPMTMPSASTGGIPFDSSLAPTVKPPVVNAQKLDTAPDGKKILTAGK